MDLFKIEWSEFYLSETAHEHAPLGLGVYAVGETRGKTRLVDKLWYIGKAQNIRQCIRKHKQEWSHAQSKETINRRCFCFGEIKPLSGKRVSAQQLGDIESILINTYKPEGNDPQTKKGYVGKPILVINSSKFTTMNRVVCHDPKLLTILAESLHIKPTVRKRKRSPSPSGWPF
jgi:hypothetical protein